MRRRSLALGLVPAVPLLIGSHLACSGAAARIGLVMRTPQGLLDAATSVELSVFPADQAKCDAATGHVNAIPGGDDTERFSLESSGCPSGVRWCKDIELDQDGSEKMFAVVAQNAGRILAEGCTVVAIDQDPLEVTIKVQRYNPPPCCNDGMLQASEQCDFGGQAAAACGGITADEVCESDCTTKEILLSVDDTSEPFVVNGPPRTKSQLSMIFAPLSLTSASGDPLIVNALRAVYHNSNPDDANGGHDIAIRFLSEDLYTITEQALLTQQLLLPLACASVTGDGLTRAQLSPSITTLSAYQTVIVYTSDQATPNNFDVWLVAHTADGCKDECVPGDAACAARDTPVQLNVTIASPGATEPDVAGGPPDTALAVWTNGSRVLGRIWKNTGEKVPPAEEILISDNGSHARVAGTSGGWVVVYQGSGSGDSDGIFLKTITPNAGVTSEVLVNSFTDGLQEQPDVATLSDGRIIVVWRSATDIFLQRFGANGASIEGDQEQPLNTTLDGEQSNPAVTAAGGFGEFFAVAWEHQAAGEIYARFPGASEGFLFNSVTGQNGDFPASHPAVQGVRRLPSVAIGGAGHVAIGWQDDSDTHTGVYVRRFPLPTTQ